MLCSSKYFHKFKNNAENCFVYFIFLDKICFKDPILSFLEQVVFFIFFLKV